MHASSHRPSLLAIATRSLTRTSRGIHHSVVHLGTELIPYRELTKKPTRSRRPPIAYLMHHQSLLAIATKSLSLTSRGIHHSVIHLERELTLSRALTKKPTQSRRSPIAYLMHHQSLIAIAARSLTRTSRGIHHQVIHLGTELTLSRALTKKPTQSRRSPIASHAPALASRNRYEASSCCFSRGFDYYERHTK